MADPVKVPGLILRAPGPPSLARGLDAYMADGTWLGPVISYEIVGEGKAEVEIKIRMLKCRVATDGSKEA